jgi:hypothetical protein
MSDLDNRLCEHDARFCWWLLMLMLCLSFLIITAWYNRVCTGLLSLCYVLFSILVSVIRFWIYVVIWAEHRAEVRTAWFFPPFHEMFYRFLSIIRMWMNNRLGLVFRPVLYNLYLQHGWTRYVGSRSGKLPESIAWAFFRVPTQDLPHSEIRYSDITKTSLDISSHSLSNAVDFLCENIRTYQRFMLVLGQIIGIYLTEQRSSWPTRYSITHFTHSLLGDWQGKNRKQCSTQTPNGTPPLSAWNHPSPKQCSPVCSPHLSLSCINKLSNTTPLVLCRRHKINFTSSAPRRAGGNPTHKRGRETALWPETKHWNEWWCWCWCWCWC